MLKFTKEQRKAFDRSKIVKPMGKSRILAAHLDKALMTFDDKWSFKYAPKQTDSAWHPSGHCTPTVTQLYEHAVLWLPYFAAEDEYEVVTPATTSQKNFMVGHFWHQLIQYIVVRDELAPEASVERVGTKFFSHYPFDPAPYHWVRGSGDIVPYKTDDWEGLVDIKTMRSSHFNQPGLPIEFAEKYICQVNIYMDLFDQDQALFLCVNKDTSEFKEITFVKNQELIDAIYTKWQYVASCLDLGQPPTPEDDEYYSLPEVSNE